MMPLMMGGQQAQNMNWFNIGNNNNNNNPIGLLSTNSSTSSSIAANPFIGDQSLSSLMMNKNSVLIPQQLKSNGNTTSNSGVDQFAIDNSKKNDLNNLNFW